MLPTANYLHQESLMEALFLVLDICAMFVMVKWCATADRSAQKTGHLRPDRDTHAG